MQGAGEVLKFWSARGGAKGEVQYPRSKGAEGDGYEHGHGKELAAKRRKSRNEWGVFMPFSGFMVNIFFASISAPEGKTGVKPYTID